LLIIVRFGGIMYAKHTNSTDRRNRRMEEKVVVEFINDMKQTHVDLEIPLEITANDLVLALNEAYGLGMDTDNIFSCYLVAENPIAFLRGNKTLKEFGIRNGSYIIYRRA